MNNKHTQYFYGCAIPGAVGDGYIDERGELVSGARTVINGPPEDGRCGICRRHISEVEPFGGSGDPCLGDFTGMKLIKQFREDYPNYIIATWECRDCIQRAGSLWEIAEEDRLGRALSTVERIQLRAELETALEAMHRESTC